MLAILKLLIGGIAGPLAEAYKARQVAQTDQERIAADERVSRLEQIAAVQKAESGSRINAVMRFLIALPPALYLGKIFAVDKVACPVFALPATYCRTDSLDPNLWSVVTAVIGFYFLYEGGVGIARIFKRR